MWEHSPCFLLRCLLFIGLLISTTADTSRYDKQVTRSKRDLIDAKTVGNALYSTPEEVIRKREEIPIPSTTIKAVETDGVIGTIKAEDTSASKNAPETGDVKSKINVKDPKSKDSGLLARIKTNADKTEKSRKRSKGEKTQRHDDVDSKAEEEDESLIKGMDSNVDHPLVDSDLTKQYRESTDIDHGEMMGIETERDVTIGEPINSDNSLLKHTITNNNIENDDLVRSEHFLTEQKRDSVTPKPDLTVVKRHDKQKISSSKLNFAVVKRSASLDNDLLPLSRLNTQYALDEGELQDGGPPSHFQVDDKSADLEINANSAGVKVKAKPASLQVVSRPGSPHSHPYIIPQHQYEELGDMGFHHPHHHRHHHHHHHSCCHHEGYRRRRCCVDHPHRKCCHHNHHHRRHHLNRHTQSRHVNFVPEGISEEESDYRHTIRHPPNRWGSDPLAQILTTFAEHFIGERNNEPEVENIEPTSGFSVADHPNNMHVQRAGSRRSYGRYGAHGYGTYSHGYLPAPYHDVRGFVRSDVETAIDPRLGSSSFANGFNSGIALPDEDSMYLNHFRPETLDDRERIHQNHLRQLQDSTYRQFADELAYKEQNIALDQHRYPNFHENQHRFANYHQDQHRFANVRQAFHHTPTSMHQHELHAFGDDIPDPMAREREQVSRQTFHSREGPYHDGYHGNHHHENDPRHTHRHFHPYPKYAKYQERLTYFDAPNNRDDTFSGEETIDKSAFRRHSPDIERSELAAHSIPEDMDIDDGYRKRSIKHTRTR